MLLECIVVRCTYHSVALIRLASLTVQPSLNHGLLIRFLAMTATFAARIAGMMNATVGRTPQKITVD